MVEFFAELKRRHIYRVGAAYVVVAWALTQVVEILAQVFSLPLWIAQTAIVLLAIGFPIALLAAWTIEKKAHQAVASAVRSKPTIVDWTLCGALVVVIVLIGYQQIARPTGELGVNLSPKSPASPGATVSLAVLPFANLSGDSAQEFFSDGMTEEITAALAKVADLQVVARASAFQFKGEKRDMRTVGQALGASYLIDGSVRKAGNRVRITAQLIRSDNGVNVWSDSYDRELTDVFATQEDIARAIAGSLRVPLGLPAGAELVSNRGIDPESYQEYLRARTLLRSRGARVAEAIRILEPLVLRSKDYAPAWALLSNAYYWAPQNFAAPPLEAREKNRQTYLDYSLKAEHAARQAIRLDARQSIAFGVLAGVRARDGKWAEGDELFSQALSVDPNDPETLHIYRHTLAVTGRLKEAMTTSERLLTLEPFVPIFNAITEVIALANGEPDRALEINTKLPSLRGGNAYALAAKGRFTDAANVMAEIEPLSGLTPAMRAELATAAQLLARAPAKSTDPLPDFDSPQLAFVYGYVGAPERLIEYPEREFDQHSFDGAAEGYYIWGPIAAETRKTERFKTLVRNAGLVDYWRVRGWPPQCHPTTGDDFACD